MAPYLYGYTIFTMEQEQCEAGYCDAFQSGVSLAECKAAAD